MFRILLIGVAVTGAGGSASLAQDLVCYDYDSFGRIERATYSDGSQIEYDLDHADSRETLHQRTGQVPGCATPTGSSAMAMTASPMMMSSSSSPSMRSGPYSSEPMVSGASEMDVMTEDDLSPDDVVIQPLEPASNPYQLDFVEEIRDEAGQLLAPWISQDDCSAGACVPSVVHAQTGEIAMVDGRLAAGFIVTDRGEQIVRVVEDE